MNIKIIKLTTADIGKFMELISVFENVFEMKNFKMPGKDYLQNLLNKEDFFAFVAINENEVVGGLTSYIMHQYYSERPLVYIYDLAVRNSFQRRGIGKQLIAENLRYCKEIGVEVVMVQADEIDDYAIEFYKSSGGNGQNVIHFDYLLDDNTID